MKKIRKLHLLETSQGLQQEIYINIIRLLSRLNKKDIIVIIVNQFTKMIRFKITIKTILLEEIAKIYRNNIWKIYQVPRNILNNKGSQFISRFIKDFNKTLRMKQILSIVYHPQNRQLNGKD